ALHRPGALRRRLLLGLRPRAVLPAGLEGDGEVRVADLGSVEVILDADPEGGGEEELGDHAPVILGGPAPRGKRTAQGRRRGRGGAPRGAPRRAATATSGAAQSRSTP